MKETCEYCPHFQYGFCNWNHQKRKKNQEICQDAVQGFELPEDSPVKPRAGRTV